MFDAADARWVFDVLSDADHPSAGRDFVFTLERESAEAVRGQVVAREVDELVLLIEGEPNEHVMVPWVDIRSIRVEVVP